MKCFVYNIAFTNVVKDLETKRKIEASFYNHKDW